MKPLSIFIALTCLLTFICPMPETPAEVTGSDSGLVTLDFEKADIRDVIKVIAMASDMNMVIGEGVEAAVSISLKDMPWEQALDIILRTYNFTYKREGNLIRIMTFDKVKQEARDIPLITKIIYLNFADANTIKGTLTKVLSDRGSIQTDKRTNSMLITDIPDRITEAEKISKELDTRTPQVLIEAMLVDVKLTHDDELGINWKIIGVNPFTTREDSADYIEQPAAPMSALSAAAIKIGWTQRLGEYGLDGLIQAWVQDAKANILASPKIITLDNQTAKIEIKSQIAYTQHVATDQGTTTSTQFKDVITGLEVTPHITKEGFVSMKVIPRQEFVEAMVSGEPQIGTRTAETNVLVKDGETIVIGGLRKVEDNATYTKIPFLGDIPILGNLFRKRDLQKINTELVMFVTPRIITHPDLSEEEEEKLKMLDEAREEFIEQMEKERKQKENKERQKERKEQARLPEPGIGAEFALPQEELSQELEVLTSPAVQEELSQYCPEETQDLEVSTSPAACEGLVEPWQEEGDYIYSW
jgi:type IV pilus assembly protein PilQ